VHARRPAEQTALRARRLELSPRVGEALQLTNILLDWPTDVRHGRSYLPASWLSELGLTVADLTRTDRPELRELALRLEGLAHAALDQVADYLDTIPRRHLRYRLFCLWPALWARASLRLVHGAPEFPAAAGRPRLSRSQLWGSAARSLLFVNSHRGVRRMLAEDAPPPPGEPA
jgi:farnesyl-diphosphate farnesyltransferase